jgi:hypothetical protein
MASVLLPYKFLLANVVVVIEETLGNIHKSVYPGYFEVNFSSFISFQVCLPVGTNSQQNKCNLCKLDQVISVIDAVSLILLSFLLLIQANFWLRVGLGNTPHKKKLIVLSLRPGAILTTENKKKGSLFHPWPRSPGGIYRIYLWEYISLCPHYIDCISFWIFWLILAIQCSHIYYWLHVTFLRHGLLAN